MNRGLDVDGHTFNLQFYLDGSMEELVREGIWMDSQLCVVNEEEEGGEGKDVGDDEGDI